MAKTATSRTPTAKIRESAADAAVHHEHDDVVVATIKRLGAYIQEHARVLAVVGLIALVAALIITVQVLNATEREQEAATALAEAKTIARLKLLLQEYADDDELRPLIYLKLFETLDTATEPDLLNRRTLQVTYADEFLAAFEDDDTLAATLESVQQRRTIWKSDVALLQRQKRDRDSIVDDAKARVASFPATELMRADDPRHPVVALHTDVGVIKLELFDRVAPNLVRNLLYLVRRGFFQYDGPANEVRREDVGSLSPTRAVFGELPKSAIGAIGESPSTNLEQLQETLERAKSIDTKWGPDVERGTLGYGLPAAPEAFREAHTFGSLALWCEGETGQAPNPHSGSSVMFINLRDNQRAFNRMHPVFGRVLVGDDGEMDRESVETLQRIGTVGARLIATRRVRVRAGLTERTFARRTDDRQDESDATYEPASVQWLREYPIDSGAYLPAGALNATHVRVPIDYSEEFAAGATYLDADGERHTVDEVTRVPLATVDQTRRLDLVRALANRAFPWSSTGMRAVLSSFERRAHSIVIERFRPAIDADGEELTDESLPRVYYPGSLIPQPVLDAPPTEQALPSVTLEDDPEPEDERDKDADEDDAP